MNRNVYDTDCVTWSPQGRIFQIEYATEAVKQGSCVVGVRSKTHAVLCALRRSVSKLAEYNAKLIKVDDHIGVTFSGITADANLIVRGLRSDCLNHRYVFEDNVPVERLLSKLASKSQENTQNISRRPYGVGLLIAGYDQTGPHIYETTPSGDYVEYYATAFGARCQAAKTLLENEADTFADATPEKLLEIALRALAATAAADTELCGSAIHVGIVGAQCPWRVLDADELDAKLRALDLVGRSSS